MVYPPFLPHSFASIYLKPLYPPAPADSIATYVGKRVHPTLPSPSPSHRHPLRPDTDAVDERAGVTGGRGVGRLIADRAREQA